VQNATKKFHQYQRRGQTQPTAKCFIRAYTRHCDENWTY
jgi:hypothetical protein